MLDDPKMLESIPLGARLCVLNECLPQSQDVGEELGRTMWISSSLVIPGGCLIFVKMSGSLRLNMGWIKMYDLVRKEGKREWKTYLQSRLRLHLFHHDVRQRLIKLPKATSE